MGVATPTPELLALAQQIVTAAESRSLPLRAIGGVAIEMRAPDRHPGLRREYGDLDVAAPGNRRRDVEQAMRAVDLVPEERFNKVQGALRQIWWAPGGETHVDVFLGEFAMCHRLSFEGRLIPGALAMPAADLLLMKLQVVELNLKDATDASALLATHELADDDAEGRINRAYIASVLCDDWGFFTTATDNLRRIPEIVAEVGRDVAPTVARTCDELLAALEEAPKSRSFKLRARVGRRKRWYELPEESL